jgi:hypothetical protein
MWGLQRQWRGKAPPLRAEGTPPEGGAKPPAERRSAPEGGEAPIERVEYNTLKSTYRVYFGIYMFRVR